MRLRFIVALVLWPTLAFAQTSNTITITITPAPSLALTGPATAVSGSSVTLTATIANPTGTPVVEFLEVATGGQTLLGEDPTPPYTFTIGSIAPGITSPTTKTYVARVKNVVAGNLAERTLVVQNLASPMSQEIAADYLVARQIPAANLCSINTTLGWNWWITDAQYKSFVRDPVRTCVDARGRSQILYIVFAPPAPYGAYDTIYGASSPQRATDSLLADMWTDAVPSGGLYNYYQTNDMTVSGTYAPFQTFASWRAANPSIQTYSVWRLWGTRAQSAALVQRGLAVEQAGRLTGNACWDARYGKTTFTTPDSGYAAGDNDLIAASQFTVAAGMPTTLDVNDAQFGTAPAPLRCENAALYAGWYQYGWYNDAFSWAPGAIGWHLDSLAQTWSEGALAQGITTTVGVVGEPYLSALAHPDSVTRDLLAGANVGDAFMRHTYYLKWMNIQYGDPLYRPFPQ